MNRLRTKKVQEKDSSEVCDKIQFGPDENCFQNAVIIFFANFFPY